MATLDQDDLDAINGIVANQISLALTTTVNKVAELSRHVLPTPTVRGTENTIPTSIRGMISVPYTQNVNDAIAILSATEINRYSRNNDAWDIPIDLSGFTTSANGIARGASIVAVIADDSKLLISDSNWTFTEITGATGIANSVNGPIVSDINDAVFLPCAFTSDIHQWKISDKTYVGKTTLIGDVIRGARAAIDDTHMYVLTHNDPANDQVRLLKVNLTTMTVEETLDMTSVLTIDHACLSAYKVGGSVFVCRDNSGLIVVVDAATMTVTKQTFVPPYNNFYGLDILPSGDVAVVVADSVAANMALTILSTSGDCKISYKLIDGSCFYFSPTVGSCEYSDLLQRKEPVANGGEAISLNLLTTDAAGSMYLTELDMPALETGQATEVNATANKAEVLAALPVAPDNAGIAAIGVSVSALGEPLQTDDARLDNLDAKVSTRSTLTAQGVWEYATRTVTSLGTLVADIWAYATRTITEKTGFALASTERVKLAATQPDYAPAKPGEAMTLTGAYEAAKTAASEANATLNKNTVISAMPAAPDNTGIAELNARVPAAPATEGNVTAVGVAVATRASQASVNAIPTTPLLAGDYVAPDNAAIADIQAKLSNATYGLAALKALVDGIDTSTELQARFDEIKGVDWTVETLKNVKDAVETLVSSYASAFGEFTPGFLKGYATVVDDSPQRIPRGDATAFTFTLPSGWDLTNRIVYFTAKEDLDSDNDTAIFSRACTIISARVCSITLTSAETGKVGNYQAELRSFAADGSDPKTAQRFPLEIYQDVRAV